LLTGFYRARTSDHHDGVTSDFDAAHVDYGAMRLRLPADEFVRLRNRDNGFDAGCHLQSFNLVSPPASNRSNDCALGPARDVRLVSRLADAFDYVFDFLIGCSFGHIHNHVSPLFRLDSIQKAKTAILENRGYGTSELFR
jgi:hypothetical protein